MFYNDVLFQSYLYMMIMILMIYMYKYMLVMLMVIEFLVLIISMMMFFMFGLLNLEFFMIYYLVFSVCEGTLGLVLLVLIVRFCGNDNYFLFNLSKF